MRVSCISFTLCIVASVAHAETLGVGSGRSYASPCEAVAHAAPHDVIEIAAGTYTDSCALNVSGLTLRGVGGRPKVDLSGTDHPAQYKAIYVVAAADVTIENLELTGAHVSDANGANAAALRIEADGLHVLRCDIHDNQNGILGGSSGTVTIEHTELFNNGLGDGCNGAGCTHNVYIGEVDALYFRFNWSHHVATDTDDKGHLLKSRAKQNFLLYNRLSGEDGYDSYEVDLPNGGLAVLVGNVIQKGKQAGNATSVSWGEEGVKHPDTRVFLINNTFVSALSSGRYVNVKDAQLTTRNNLFVGAQGMQAPAGLSGTDLVVSDARFVDADHYDYHLSAQSPARGAAMSVMALDGLPLLAASEYVHPVGDAPRASVHDVGAFEYAADGGAAEGLDAGAADGGSVARAGMGAGGELGGTGGTGGTLSGRAGAASAGVTASPETGAGGKTDAAADGCGCSALGSAGRSRAAGMGLVGLSAWAWARRRRRGQRGAL